jgi:hypothetical protein
MIRNPKNERRKVKALTDPQPEFVSLVSAGANMTPFRSVKAAVVPEAAAPAVDAAAPTDEVVAEKADTHDVVKIEFKSDMFVDEAAVKLWLDNGGYEGYVVEKTDDGFRARGETTDEEVSAKSVEMEGLTIFVAERAAPSGKAVEGQPTDVQLVAKSDDAEPAVEAEKVEEVVAEKAAEPVVEAEAPVEAKKSLYAIAGLTDVVMALQWLASDMSWEAEMSEKGTPESVGALKAMAAEGLRILSGMAAEEANEMASKEADPVPEVSSEKSGEVAAVPAEETVVEKTEEAAPAVSPLEKAVLSLVDVVSQLTKSVGDLQSDATAKSEVLAARVDALESERQSRKGADVEETPPRSPQAEKKTTGLGDLMFRSALGIQRRNS